MAMSAALAAPMRLGAKPPASSSGARRPRRAAPRPRPATLGLGHAAPSTSTSRRTTRVVTSANIFSRLTRVLKSYANSLLSAAEDPERILDQAVVDMTQDLTKLRQATAQVMASQKQLEKKANDARAQADQWQRRAQLALTKGDEDLAKEALLRRRAQADAADNLATQLEMQKTSVSKLMANGKVLETKLAEAKSKKDTLKARAQSARTQKRVGDITSGIDTTSSLAAFEKMEEKVMALESEAESVEMLSAPDASLEAAFKGLETSDVDDDLALLKASMGPKGSLPEGRSVKGAFSNGDEIDAEIRQMRRDQGTK